jgi:peptidoglycan/xylan/chitin deacetylase (PgdA/CDA1 family)
MPFYVAGYDTEPVYPWWEIGDHEYSAELYHKVVSYEGERLQEFLAGTRTVAEVHLKHGAAATFFIVAKLLEHAGAELREILDHPGLDVQCHTFTHEDLIALGKNDAALKYELVDSKKLIEDTFGRPVIGLTAPGSFTRGLLGEKRTQEILWDAGYRYVRSVGKGPFNTVPAPMTQPFWYSQEGYPEMLEIPINAWHDNVLTGQPFAAHWPPVIPWGLPAKTAENAQEAYEAYAPGIDHAVEEDLLCYTPGFHPWSVYRLDKKAGHIDKLLSHASSAAVTIA